jgi:hypothetical protein
MIPIVATLVTAPVIVLVTVIVAVIVAAIVVVSVATTAIVLARVVMTPIVPALVVPIIAVLASARVFVAVPPVLHEENATATGVVLAAVLTPVLLVAGRNVQVERLGIHIAGNTLDDHGLRVDHGRSGVVAERELPVEAGLVHADRHGHVACEGRRGQQHQGGCK